MDHRDDNGLLYSQDFEAGIRVEKYLMQRSFFEDNCVVAHLLNEITVVRTIPRGFGSRSIWPAW